MKNLFIALLAIPFLFAACSSSTSPYDFNEKVVQAQTVIVRAFQDFSMKVDATDKSQLHTLEPERQKLEDTVKAELTKLSKLAPAGTSGESFKTNAIAYFQGIAGLISNEYKALLRADATEAQRDATNKTIIEKNNALVDAQSRLITEQEEYSKQNNFEVK